MGFLPLTVSLYNVETREIEGKAVLKKIFTEARSGKIYRDSPVSEEQLRSLYELAKWAPSESNSCPLRLVFVHSDDAKARLRPHVAEGNLPKYDSAPVTAIVAYDTAFTEQLSKLAPHLSAPTYFDTMPDDARDMSAQRSAHLQAGMLIAAVRALGWTAGPMAGVDRAGIDDEFLSESSWRTSFVMLLGEADEREFYPRGPRLEFDEACQVV